MSELSKEQVRLLNPEQQEQLAEMELRQMKHHQQLQKQARDWRGLYLTINLFFLAFGLGLTLVPAAQAATSKTRWFSFFLLAFIMVAANLALVHRRIDALVELRGRNG